MEIKDRIVDFRRVPASELRPNPKNWRVHPDGQKQGLKTVLAEIGMADAVIARTMEDGGLELIDGHLRTETLTDTPIPTLIVDLNDAEADTVLATLDPLASLASPDLKALSSLMQGLDTENDSLNILLEDIADNYSLGFRDLNEQDTEADYADHDWEEDEQRNRDSLAMKAVVLHLQEKEYDLFYERAFELGDKWNLDNLADVVMRAITETYQREFN